MIKSIASLSADEQKILYEAIPYITILVAGADGIIDDAELAAAEKTAHVRSFHYEHEEWMEFYKKADENLHDQLHEMINHLPRETDKRQQAVSEKLARLNDVLPKMDRRQAKHFYDGLLTFADHIAKASGGFIGWMSVGPKEAEVTSLPMIEPVK
jgi:hypothetical protein